MAKKKFSELRDNLSPEIRAAARVKTAVTLAGMPLQELRQARKMSQVAIAKVMDSDQPNVSRLEKQADMYVSTVRSYVEAMGGQLDITASFPEGSYRINQFEEIGSDESQEELVKTRAR